MRLGVGSIYVSGLALAATLALLVGWLQSEDFQRRAIAFAEALIEQASGESCTITRIDLRLWPPALEADGFHLFNPLTGDSIVSLDHLRVPLVLRDGTVKIGRLSLVEPTVQLHLDADGKLVEFQHAPRPDEPKPLRELPWASLEIRDGSFRIEAPDGSVHIADLDLTPDPDTGRGTLTADLDLVARDLEIQTRLELPDLRVGPEAIDIPVLALDTDLLRLEGRAHIPLQGELDVDLTAHVELEEAQPLLTAPRTIRGGVDLDARIQGSTADPQVALAATASQLVLQLPGVFTPLLTYELGDLQAVATASKDGVQLERVKVLWGDGQLVAWGAITPEKELVGGHVMGERVSLEHLLKAFDAAPTPWIDMDTDLEVVWGGTLDPLRLEGTFDLVVDELQVGDRPISDPHVSLMLDIPHAYARGTLLLEQDHILLESDDVVGPRSHGHMSVDIGFGPRGPLALDATLERVDLADFQPLNGVEMTGTGLISGRIWGPFNGLQFDGNGDISDFSVLGIPYADHLVARIQSPTMNSIELHDARALRGTSKYSGEFAMDFRSPISMMTDIAITDGRVEDLVGMFIDLPGMTGALTGTLELDGPLYDMDGAAHLEVADVDLWGERFPAGTAHGYMDQGLFTLDELVVRRHDGSEGLVLRGSVERDWALNMELMGDAFALERMDLIAPKELPLSGRISFLTRISNTLFDPSPAGWISVDEVRYAGREIADSTVTFDTHDGVAHYLGEVFGGAALVDGTLGLWGEQPYALTASLQRLPAHVFYPTAADGTPIEAIASGQLELSGHFGEEWSPVTLDTHLTDVEVKYAHHELRNPEPWSYAQDGRRFKLQGFSLQGGATDFKLAAQGGDALLLAGEGTVDLDLLRAFVPGLEKSTGRADVVLYAVGAKPDVQAVVDIDVDAELFRHTSVPATFEDVEARIRVTDAGIALQRVAGDLGGGRFEAKGRIDSEAWIPKRYNIKMQVDDAQVQWVESLPPAIGDATLAFDGPTEALLLAGEVEISDMTFSDRIDWEDWVVEYRDEMLVDPASAYDEEPWFNMSVHIVADRTIHLRNNVAEGTASADLRVIGDTSRPGLVGEVRVVDGVAFLQDREFILDRANVLFNDPWTWDPDLDFALMTDIDSNDQRYRVNYLVFGPFSDWRTATRSDPALPQSDVNALLWFGMTTEDLEEMGALTSAVAQGVADLILTDLLITGQAGVTGEELPDFLFDSIDLSTGVNARGEYSPEPRLVVEKRIDDLDDLDLTWEFNLGRPEDSYLRADKRIGGIWSLSGWYATLQRDRVLPIGGAYGVDVTARWETD